jgi:hypothetical protein
LEDYLIPYLGSVRLCRLRGGQISATYAGIIAERNQTIAQVERAQRANNSRVGAQGRTPHNAVPFISLVGFRGRHLW